MGQDDSLAGDSCPPPMKIFSTHKTVVAVIGIVLLLFGFFVLGRFVDLEETLNPSRLATLLDEAGSFAPLIFILSMAVAVVISPIPSLPLDLAAGAAFGPFLGTTYAVIGAEIGAILSFLIGRALGQDLLTKLLRTNVAFCEQCSDAHLMILLVLARLLPVFSFDIISYGAGLTNMSLKAFAIATLVGMIPPTFALTYLGSSVVSIQWPLILTGIVMVGFFLLTPKLVMRYPSTWWARLFLAAAPTPIESNPILPESAPESGKQAPCCSGCGVNMRLI